MTSADTILYLDERATRMAGHCFDPVSVVATAYRLAIRPAVEPFEIEPGIECRDIDDRLSILVDRLQWLDVCLVSSQWLRGVRHDAAVTAVATRLRPGVITAAVIGTADPQPLVRLLAANAPGLASVAVAGASLDSDERDSLRSLGILVEQPAGIDEALHGANVVLASGPVVLRRQGLAADTLVIGARVDAADHRYRLPDLFAPGTSHPGGIGEVVLDDLAIAARSLHIEVHRAAVRLGIGVRLPR
jgi:hypothetical protein